jgi:hypothetical protein
MLNLEKYYMRNVRASPCVLLMFSWNGIDVIFFY